MSKRIRLIIKKSIRWFLITEAIALSIGLILHIYGGLGPFDKTMIIAVIYGTLNSLSFITLKALFKISWKENKPWTRSSYLKNIAVFFLATVIGTEFGTQIVSAWLKREFIPLISLWHLYLLLMNMGVSMGVVTILGLYRTLKYRLDRRDREYMELENLQVKTRLAALQAKLDPHFLFNTLNVILDLAVKAPEKIESVVLNLSDIYRKTLGHSEDAWSTLGEEVELVRKYLEIEKIRLEKRLTFHIEYDPALARTPVPPMLLEPLVENAVIHGISPKKDGGAISLSIGVRGDRLEIVIEDNGVGMDETLPRKGFGLHSVRERLQLIYGQKAIFSISPLPGGGTRIRLEVPHAA